MAGRGSVAGWCMEDTGSEVGRALPDFCRGLAGLVRLLEPGQKPDSRVDRGVEVPYDLVEVPYDLVGLVLTKLSSAAVTGARGLRHEPRATTLLPDLHRRTR